MVAAETRLSDSTVRLALRRLSDARLVAGGQAGGAVNSGPATR
jgi:DNA-binding GntR family transcriptional regulator